MNGQRIEVLYNPAVEKEVKVTKETKETKETKTKKERTPVELKSNLELAKHYRTLLRVSNNLEKVKCEVTYQKRTFTFAEAELTLPSGKVLESEGVSRKAGVDAPDPNCGSNVSRRRALESLDKQLRRSTHTVGHRFEG